MTQPTMEPIHPGEILMLDYLEPLGITQHRVAVAIGVPPRRINEIVHGKRGITADTALRLARYFGTSCPSGGTPFVDIGGSFAAADIACIYALDITTGTSPTTYDPTGLVTREQMAAFLARVLRRF